MWRSCRRRSRSFAQAGFEIASSAARASAGFPDDDYAAAGASSPTARRSDGAGALACVASPSAGRRRVARAGNGRDRLPRAADRRRGDRAASRARGRRLRDGVDPADHARAVDGRALVAGDRRRLQGRRCSPPTALPRFFPMLMTAAGTVAPGEGARARRRRRRAAGDRDRAAPRRRRLGASTCGPAVQEQVESLGATFLELGVRGEETEGGYASELTPEQQAQQQAALEERIPDFDVVITTALVPGRPAPKLIPASAVERDAARLGDRRPRRRDGRQLRADRARRGSSSATASRSSASRTCRRRWPYHASQLYARNVSALLQHLAPEGELALDWDDEITARRLRDAARRSAGMSDLPLVIELTILVLAIFLGFEVISKVPTMLHTPLMSGTNAIHGIVIVGAIIVARRRRRHVHEGRRLRRRRARARRTSSAASSSPTGCSRCSSAGRSRRRTTPT